MADDNKVICVFEVLNKIQDLDLKSILAQPTTIAAAAHTTPQSEKQLLNRLRLYLVQPVRRTRIKMTNKFNTP